MTNSVRSQAEARTFKSAPMPQTLGDSVGCGGVAGMFLWAETLVCPSWGVFGDNSSLAVTLDSTVDIKLRGDDHVLSYGLFTRSQTLVWLSWTPGFMWHTQAEHTAVCSHCSTPPALAHSWLSMEQGQSKPPTRLCKALIQQKGKKGLWNENKVLSVLEPLPTSSPKPQGLKTQTCLAKKQKNN